MSRRSTATSVRFALLTVGSEAAANGMATSRLGTTANRPTEKAEEQ